jgi:hypothetical protein
LWFIARVKSMPHTAHSSHLINQKQRYTSRLFSSAEADHTTSSAKKQR